MKYDYTENGQYNETICKLDDGREMIVNTQFDRVLPLGQHSEKCDQINKMGGVCNCGLLDGIDCAAIIEDARKNGKFGQRPMIIEAQKDEDFEEWKSPRGLTLTEEMDREDTIY